MVRLVAEDEVGGVGMSARRAKAANVAEFKGMAEAVPFPSQSNRGRNQRFPNLGAQNAAGLVLSQARLFLRDVFFLLCGVADSTAATMSGRNAQFGQEPFCEHQPSDHEQCESNPLIHIWHSRSKAGLGNV
jgi:hypothetical protein